MKKHSVVVTLVALAALAGCALPPSPPPPSLGFMPGDAYGTAVIGQDQAMSALGDAEQSFNHPAAIRGDTAQGALAVASLDAIAGQVNRIPTYQHIDPLVRQDLLDSRIKIRALAGIDPNAPSQLVIDDLVAYATALRSGDTVRANALINAAPFTPGRTQAFLGNLPYLPEVARATLQTSTQFLPGGGGAPHF
jgi:hypothetical protein